MNNSNETNQRQALKRRVQRRIACEGKIVLPAVPGILDDYLARCEQTFSAAGRALSEPERQQLRQILAKQLARAFDQSQRSTITVSYSAGIAQPIRYSITTQHPQLAQIYEGWVATRSPPYFGQHADARVMTLAKETQAKTNAAVLDIGAGTGRNSLALARLDYSVDAVELTPKFAEILGDTAKKEALPVRVICEDIFKSRHLLRKDYGLIVISEVVSDFRSVTEWRSLLELAAECLAVGGKLLANAFVTEENYFNDAAAYEFAQQVYSFFLTPSELQSATQGLPLTLVANDDVHDYEKTHAAEGTWPPTAWYPDWVSGRDIFDLPRADCPVSMKWLVLQKR
jgi:SAM-dependent methyltransferase